MKDFILEFWENQAREHGVQHSASWGDNFAMALEIDVIDRWIPNGADVLDVGCANGYAALKHLSKAKHITGVDFSAEMIKQAHSITLSSDDRNRVKFRVADIRELPFRDEQFDLVYTTRVLINLPTWKEQIVGIKECLRVCRAGGRVVFSEAFWEPLVLLNSLRALKNLPPLVEHDFNRYIKKSRLESFLNDGNYSYHIEDFSSVYYIGSRFLRELLTDADAYPGYSNPVNEAFYDLSKHFSGGGFGIQMAYVVQK